MTSEVKNLTNKRTAQFFPSWRQRHWCPLKKHNKQRGFSSSIGILGHHCQVATVAFSRNDVVQNTWIRFKPSPTPTSLFFFYYNTIIVLEYVFQGQQNSQQQDYICSACKYLYLMSFSLVPFHNFFRCARAWVCDIQFLLFTGAHTLSYYSDGDNIIKCSAWGKEQGYKMWYKGNVQSISNKWVTCFTWSQTGVWRLFISSSTNDFQMLLSGTSPMCCFSWFR